MPASAQTLVETLKQEGIISDPAVEAGFLAVPRQVFLPDVPPEQVYEDKAIPVKRDADGTVLSSSSQPSMMALMLRQLRLRKGDNVLEIGAGTGYNAAIMQHIVGDGGTVTSIELDKQLAMAARDHLMRAGLGALVLIVDADGALGYAPRASYDRIIATAAIWDIPVAWEQQLKPAGILVAPIWLNGIQVSAAFTPQPDGSLYSSSNIHCGFVPLRGMAAGPTNYRRITSSGLTLWGEDMGRLDSAAIHMLLSDDLEIARLNIVQDKDPSGVGLIHYLALHVPEGYVFALYSVDENQQAYGMEGGGFALVGPGSACFVPYAEHGVVHCFAGSDAFMALQGVVDEWGQAGYPRIDKLRLRLTRRKRKTTEPVVQPNGKVYTRKEHFLYVWLEQ
jgi:protein-L-isoaspartate(D-aspartate) O-methyltransferase